MQRLAVPFTLCAVWFMAAWAIEKFWFAAICGSCSTLFAFELGLKGQGLLNISTGRVSGVVLFVVPFLVYALVLIPYRHPGSGADWSEAIQQWSRPFFWLAMVVFWVWIGEVAYSMLMGTLPDGFRIYGDGYQLHLSGTALGVREIAVNGKFGAFLGLILGLYLFLARGLARR
jgi:hypothetical protein